MLEFVIGGLIVALAGFLFWQKNVRQEPAKKAPESTPALPVAPETAAPETAAKETKTAAPPSPPPAETKAAKKEKKVGWTASLKGIVPKWLSVRIPHILILIGLYFAIRYAFTLHPDNQLFTTLFGQVMFVSVVVALVLWVFAPARAVQFGVILLCLVAFIPMGVDAARQFEREAREQRRVKALTAPKTVPKPDPRTPPGPIVVRRGEKPVKIMVWCEDGVSQAMWSKPDAAVLKIETHDGLRYFGGKYDCVRWHTRQRYRSELKAWFVSLDEKRTPKGIDQATFEIYW